MMSIPFMKYACGYWNSITNRGLVMVYITSYKKGYHRYEVIDIPTGRTTVYNTCVEKYEGFDTIVFIPITQQYTNVAINSYNCTSGEICQNLIPSTCTTVSFVGSITDIPIQSYNDVKPQILNNLISVPSQQSSTFYWEIPSDINVVAYYFELIDEHNVAVRYGMLIKNSNRLTLSDLNINTNYTFRIRPVTSSYILGDYITTQIYTQIYTQQNTQSLFDLSNPMLMGLIGIVGIIGIAIGTYIYINNRK